MFENLHKNQGFKESMVGCRPSPSKNKGQESWLVVLGEKWTWSSKTYVEDVKSPVAWSTGKDDGDRKKVALEGRSQYHPQHKPGWRDQVTRRIPEDILSGLAKGGTNGVGASKER